MESYSNATLYHATFLLIPGLLALTFFLVAFSYTEHTNGDSKVQLSQDNDEDFMPISSRNYGSTAESANNYYSTYTGYPSYGSSGSPLFTDQYNPSDFSNYYQPSDPKKKPSTPTTYPSYPFYPTPGIYGSPECHEQMMNGVVGDVLQTGGLASAGLLKSVVAAVTAGLLAKIPIILAIKALIIKLILVPFGLVVLSLPFILPIALLFTPLWTKLKETFSGTTPPPVVVMMGNATKEGPKRREFNHGQEFNPGQNVLTALMESDRCFEKFACLLGSRDAHSPLAKPVSWLLKFLQTFRFVQKNVEIRSTLKRYREAYLQGVNDGKKWPLINSTNVESLCSNELYPCDTPHLYAKPEFTKYSRYL
ncbi:hypothetical protein V9T40_008496 [Parthenolecanium corni]|uniref:Uncharacterized protein n=1 Tax=Parthenolecanium corni TaxID=536013 RepID=A0AAN9Y851_9HEMI